MDSHLANYLAGQFDAHGSVDFITHSNGPSSNQRQQHRLMVTIYAATVDQAEDLYLLLDCRGDLQPSKKGPSARIRMSCATARQFLNEIFEFTRIKKPIIQAALDQDARFVEPQV